MRYHLHEFHYRIKTVLASLVVIGFVSFTLFGCSDPDVANTGTCDGRTGTAGGSAVNMANYVPDCTQDLCSYSSEFTYGVGSTGTPHRLTATERAKVQFSTKKEFIERVPYSSGTLSGARYVTRAKSTTTAEIYSSTRSDGRTLKFLEFNKYWYSSDCNLTRHPDVWSFGVIIDGQIRDEANGFDTSYVTINRNTGVCSTIATKEKQVILTKIEDVTLENGQTYNNAIIFYYLHNNRAYVDLSMDGIESQLGISLPTKTETNNTAVQGMDIYARDLGWIAGGGFGFNSVMNLPLGTLEDFGELTTVKCL